MKTKGCKRNRFDFHKLASAFFAGLFLFSIINTYNAFAAARIFKVEDAKLTELSENADGAITSFDEQEIVSSVTFHALNDSAKYIVTLKNTDSVDHTIKGISDDNKNTYIFYEYASYEDTVVKANETFNFIVTAKYQNPVENINNRTQTGNVNFTISYEGGEEVLPLVPDTGKYSSSIIYGAIKNNLVAIIISVVGLFICAVLAIKHRQKYSKIMAAFFTITLAAATATSIKALTLEINSFIFSNTFNLNDKLAVTYSVDGEEKTVIADYGSVFQKEIPEKTGFKAEGWMKEDGTILTPDTPITSDLNVTAKYTQTAITINFHGNGLTFGNNKDINTVLVGENCKEVPVPSAVSHTSNINTDGTVNYDEDHNPIAYDNDVSNLDPIRIPGASSLRITLTYTIESGYDELIVVPGYYDHEPTEEEAPNLNLELIRRYPLEGESEWNDETESEIRYTDTFEIPGNEVTFAFYSDESVTYYGYYAAIEPLDENGEVISSEKTVTVCNYGAISGEYQEPEISDKQEFFGWNSDESKNRLDFDNFNTIINNINAEPGSSIDFYAVWLNNHSIIYNNGSYDITKPSSTYGGSIIRLSDYYGDEQDEYDFIGWSENKDATTPDYMPGQQYTVPDNTDTTVFYAIWRKKHVIHFDGNGADGGTMENQYVSTGSRPGLFSNTFTREHYDFIGWSENKDATESNYEYEENDKFTPPNEPGETTLYAVWRKQHKIVFDANGGQGTMADQWESIYTKVPLNNNQFSRTDYGFVGWSTDKNAQTATYENGAYFTIPDEAGGTTILYAIWVGDHRIIFDANGGQGTMEDQYVKKRTDGTYSTVSLNNSTFTREGYQFLGWSTNKNATSASYYNISNFTPTINATGSTTLYAVWKQQHRIIFDANGGQGTMEDQYVSDGSGVYLRRNTFEREGFAFIGWNTSKTATTAKYTDWQYVNSSQLSGNQTTLYAIWVRPYYIEFKGNGDDVEGEMRQTTMIPGIGQEGTLIPPNYERDGYGFAGWSTDQDAASKIYNTTNVPKIYGPNETITLDRPLANLANSDRIITMYAVWIPKSTEYTFQNFDKSAFESAHPNEKVVALEDTRDGNVYMIAKLADGNWWMAENMRLDLTDPNTSITVDNTNNPSSSFLTSINAYKGSSKKTLNIDCATSNTNPWSAASRACFNKYGFSAHNLYRNSTNQDYQEQRDSNNRLIYYGSGPIANSWYSYGAYYGFRTANAGYPTYDDDYGKTYPGDICPKGWKLPTGLKDGDFITLQSIYATQTSATGYKSYENWFKFPNNVVKSGFVAYDGDRGGLLTSYVQTSGMFVTGNFLGYSTTGVSVADDYYSYLVDGDSILGGGAIARAVRCIAK
ncbi:InlB B-repeat-containing protein [Candidatus Saccharibacteria bacterium]|nr:InlB B-repeat-containing protein [Candidatus Saccharibacteria bacterium]